MRDEPQKDTRVFSFYLCDLCAFLWLKLKLETGFRRNVFVLKFRAF